MTKTLNSKLYTNYWNHEILYKPQGSMLNIRPKVNR